MDNTRKTATLISVMANWCVCVCVWVGGECVGVYCLGARVVVVAWVGVG